MLLAGTRWNIICITILLWKGGLASIASTTKGREKDHDKGCDNCNKTQPKQVKTNRYRKNDDHLALITELIGPCHDRNFLETHSKCWKFYDKKKKTPRLKNIKKLQPWPLY